jgi:hypothetical protein
MTENEWKECRDPHLMLQIFNSEPDKPELGIFGCACCRRVWDLLLDERLRQAVEIREQYERRQVAEAEMKEAAIGARRARGEVRFALRGLGPNSEYIPEAAPAWAAGAAANAASGNRMAASELAACARACAEGGNWQQSYMAERIAQCELLRSMVAIA